MDMRRSLRGQPLAMLALLMAGWIVLRSLTWQAPTWAAERPMAGATAAPHLAQGLAGPGAADGQAGLVAPLPVGISLALAPAPWQAAPLAPRWYADPALFAPPSGWQAALPAQPMASHARATAMEGRSDGQQPLLAAGHQLMWMAALARVAVPPEISAYIGGQSAPAASAPVPLSPGLAANQASTTNRWSADAWLLTRKQAPMSLASNRPLYGGSQIGAVLRYQLAPSSGHRPIAYLRGSSALGGVRESEVAVGLGARPIASVPVVVAAEARGFRSNGESYFRPAAIAYTELQPRELPWDMLGEAYVQAGYVGGRFKTPFIDGQLRVDREVMDLDKLGTGGLRVGGGIWGGAQKGAKRLDIGPGATADLRVMGKPARVSMDYRFRVAGDADPGSGPALTVAAGF